jgi:hypothetical protein
MAIKTILCIEDDRFIGEMYVRSLKKAGYSVDWVVARFKYNRDCTSFRTFLTKNFTPDEYFGLTANRVTPLGALETKGYVSSNVKKILKEAGYPQTQDGKKQYLADQMKKYQKVV